MENNGTIIDKVKIKGGFSDELVASDFFTYWTKQPQVKGYMGSPERNAFRDKTLETWLKNKVGSENTIAYILAGKVTYAMMNKVSKDTKPLDFVALVKDTFPEPAKTVWEALRETGIKTLAPIKDKITVGNLLEIEEGIKLFLRIKEGKPLPKAEPKQRRRAFEGRYENTTGNHNKFWEIAINADGLFTAKWGKITNGVQGTKENYTEGEVLKLVREKENKGYVKVS